MLFENCEFALFAGVLSQIVNAEIVEGRIRLPVIECEVSTIERVLVRIGEQQLIVYEPFYDVICSLDGPLILNPLFHATSAAIPKTAVVIFPIFAMFIAARDGADSVFPSTEQENIATLMRSAIAKDFSLYVSVITHRRRGELDSDLWGSSCLSHRAAL